LRNGLLRRLAALIVGLAAILPGAAQPLHTAGGAVIIVPPDSKDTGSVIGDGT